MLKENLLALDLFIKNEYFKEYLNLLNSNLDRDKINGVTEGHHIIPAFYYKQNKLDIDNSKTNIINLRYRDHILAHYLIYKCSENKYKYRARNAVVQVFNHSSANLARFDQMNAEEKDKLLADIQADYEANHIGMPEIEKLHHKEAANRPEVKLKNSEAVKKAYANMSPERRVELSLYKSKVNKLIYANLTEEEKEKRLETIRYLPTMCLETNTIYKSQKAAAEWLMSVTGWAYSTCKGRVKDSCLTGEKIINGDYTFIRIDKLVYKELNR